MPADAHGLAEIVLGSYARCEELAEISAKWTEEDAKRCGSVWADQCAKPDLRSEMMAPSRWILQHSGAAKTFFRAWLPVERCAARLVPPSELGPLIIARAREWAAADRHMDIALCVNECVLTDELREKLLDIGAGRGFAKGLIIKYTGVSQTAQQIRLDQRGDSKELDDALGQLAQMDVWITSHPGWLRQDEGRVREGIASVRSTIQARIGAAARDSIMSELQAVDVAIDHATTMPASRIDDATRAMDQLGGRIRELRSRILARRAVVTQGEEIDSKLSALQEKYSTSKSALDARAEQARASLQLQEQLCKNLQSAADIRAYQQRRRRVDQTTGTRDVASERKTAAVMLHLRDEEAEIRRELAKRKIRFDEKRCDSLTE
jgi:hypothetical protein